MNASKKSTVAPIGKTLTAGNENKKQRVPIAWDLNETAFGVHLIQAGAQRTTLWPRAMGLLVMVLALLLLPLPAEAGWLTSPTYTVTLDAQESIGVGDPVLLDGTPVGVVYEVSGSARRARIRLTSDSALLAMRQGLVRVKEFNQFCLVTTFVKPEAPTLPEGAEIPSQAKYEHVAKVGLENYGMVLGGLAVLAVLVLILLLRGRRPACSFLLASAVAGGAGAGMAADVSNVGFSRDTLRMEQRMQQSYLGKAKAEVDSARNWLNSGLNEPTERNLIKALVTLDVLELFMAGHEERVQALRPSPLAYSRESQIKVMSDNCRELRARKARLADEINGLVKMQSAAVANSWKGLALYQSKRGDFMRRFQARSLYADELMRDVEKLVGYPTALIVSGMINGQNAEGWDKIGPNTWRSPSGTEFQDNGTLVAKLPVFQLPVVKTAPPITNYITRFVERHVTNTLVVTNTVPVIQVKEVSGPVVYRTKHVTNVVEKQVATPAPPPVVIKSVEYLTNVLRVVVEKPVTNTIFIVRTNKQVVEKLVTNVMVVITNLPTNAKAANPGIVGAATGLAGKKGKPLGELAPRTAPDKISAPQGRLTLLTLTLVAGGLVLAVVLGWVTYISWMRGRPYNLKLETAPGKAEDFEIGAMDEAVVLRSPPVCEAENFVNGSPCVVVGWLGARLRPGNEGAVLLNDTQVKRIKRLRPGDRIAVTKGSDQTQNYQFLSCDPMVPDAVEA